MTRPVRGRIELIAAEIRALRKGRGIGAADLESRVGPFLRDLASTAGGDQDAARRRLLVGELGHRATSLARDFRLAILASLGISVETRHMTNFKDRVAWLAATLDVDYRTALRRIDHAERLLAEQISVELDRRRTGVAPREWYTDEFRVLLRLDTPTPESHEHRRIVSIRDGLREIIVALDIPTQERDEQPRLAIEMLYGGRLLRREQPARTRFEFAVALPAPLAAGASHEYGLLFRIPDGQLMRPHYVFTPEVSCRTFSLRVRFDPDRRPVWVRRVEGETVRVFDEAAHAGPSRVELDDAGEVLAQFHEPTLHLGYGLQWR